MILVDTSAWIEFLRDTCSASCDRVTTAIRAREVVVTDPVMLELMSGARPHEVDNLLRLLSEQDYRPVVARLDWLDAAEIYRTCRRTGRTVRSQLECLMAAVAIRLGLPILHHDRDFDAIASATALRVASPGSA